MNYQEAKELHDLVFSFIGMFHEKISYRFRRYHEGIPWMKKNHIKIINLLYQHKHLTSTEIGKKLDIEKGSLTSLIDQLEDKGLVIRCNDAKDRRKFLISLSAKGREEVEKILDYHIREINEFFQEVNPDEMKEFVFELRHVVDFMKKM
jgi:DNA-binding MarR family transcriptional regulator